MLKEFKWYFPNVLANIAVTIEESKPPDRKVPIGLSDINLFSTAL